MRKLFYISFLFQLLPFWGESQIEVNGTLQFTNATDSLRTISGISKIDSLDEGLRYQDFLYSTFYKDEINTIDSVLQITPAFEFPSYQTGMMLTVQIPLLTDTVNTPAYININSNGMVAIKNISGTLITNEQMRSGNFLILLYNGTEFIAVNQETRKCPSGYKQMNENYCIQINRNAQNYFWNALQTCMSTGNHLCSMDEWYYACYNNTGLNQIPLSYEWVHSTSNHNYYAVIIGSGTCTTTNEGDTTPIAAVLKYRFRCCYKLR